MTLRDWLDVSDLSCVMRIGHPLSRSLCGQSLTTGGGSKGAEPRFDTELSKVADDDTLPQPAFTNPAL
jgi:hypothetical protein